MPLWFGVLSVLAAASSLAAAHVRIGYGDYAPLYFTSADGKPAGLLIDVINEAARRQRVSITWVSVGQGPEYGLRNGLIDIWPAAGVTQPRRGEFHVSEPWWASDMLFLTHRNSGFYRWEDLAGRPIAAQMNVQVRQWMQQALGGRFKLLPVESTDAVTVFCTGRAEALLLESVAAQRFLLNRPDACRDIRLSLIAWPEGMLPLALMSTHSHAPVVTRLRQAIEGLTADGTLMQIAARWPPVNVRTAETLMTSLRMRQQRQTYIGVLSVLVVAFAVGSLFFLRLRREIRDRRRTEAELEHKATELAQSNEHLEQFAYASAHDLQEPLRNVSLASQMLSRKVSGRLDQDAENYVGFIVTGVERMQAMIGDLLAYSRASEGGPAPTTAQTDANAVLRNVIENMRSTLAASGAVVTCGPLPQVAIDETHLMQVFQNLISNAVKYRSDSPPEVRVSASRNGAGWAFAVVDNGVGIDPKYHDRIFGVFKRLHGREVPGTGMGLAICRRILARYGGRIWVESELGRGATFRFTLPAN
jgi:signal transduction histidine kinase